MRIGENSWTEAQVETLKTLWEGGDSASVIAERMKMTRNAILGKVHRLELTPRAPRNGFFYSPLAARSDRKAPTRIRRISVFKTSGEKAAPVDVSKRTPPLVAIMSPITGAFINSKRMRPYQPEYTKDQLRAQLTQAVLNTARMA